jgi:hypothetical protein
MSYVDEEPFLQEGWDKNDRVRRVDQHFAGLRTGRAERVMSVGPWRRKQDDGGAGRRLGDGRDSSVGTGRPQQLLSLRVTNIPDADVTRWPRCAHRVPSVPPRLPAPTTAMSMPSLLHRPMHPSLYGCIYYQCETATTCASENHIAPDQGRVDGRGLHRRAAAHTHPEDHDDLQP